MRTTNWIVVGLLIGPANLAAAARDNELPKEVREAFEKATEVSLYSLDPGPMSKEEGAFHGWRVLGKTTIKDEEFKLVRDAIENGIKKSNGAVAACFNPRHGVRIVQDKNTYDLVICYECLSAITYAGDKRLGKCLDDIGAGRCP